MYGVASINAQAIFIKSTFFLLFMPSYVLLWSKMCGAWYGWDVDGKLFSRATVYLHFLLLPTFHKDNLTKLRKFGKGFFAFLYVTAYVWFILLFVPYTTVGKTAFLYWQTLCQLHCSFLRAGCWRHHEAPNFNSCLSALFHSLFLLKPVTSLPPPFTLTFIFWSWSFL